MSDIYLQYQDGISTQNNNVDETLDIEKLTNKKKEYLQDAIIDKNGAYSYLEDPQEYKKARKRLQNRESAVRSRQRKKNYQEILEQKISEQNDVIEEIIQKKNELQDQNDRLTLENATMKNQLAFYQDSTTSSVLKGFNETTTTSQEHSDEDLDQKLADLLKKINHRFQNEQKTQNRESLSLKLNGEVSEKRQKIEQIIEETEKI